LGMINLLSPPVAKATDMIPATIHNATFMRFLQMSVEQGTAGWTTPRIECPQAFDGRRRQPVTAAG
jgi:hypothetical protein